MSNDDGTTLVDYYKLADTAKRLRKTAQSIETHLQSMKQWLNLLGNIDNPRGGEGWESWAGPAQKLYVAELKKRLGNTDGLYEDYLKFPDELMRRAEAHAAADGVALNIAEEVQAKAEAMKADWAHVE